MDIFVEFCGKTITLNVVPSLTIKIVKAMLKRKEGIPIKKKFLMGKYALLDNRTLSDYNIQRQSTIIMHLRIRGGDVGLPLYYLLNHPHHDADDNYDDDDVDDIDSNATTIPWGLEEEGNMDDTHNTRPQRRPR